jgi:hypothetical protein
MFMSARMPRDGSNLSLSLRGGSLSRTAAGHAAAIPGPRLPSRGRATGGRRGSLPWLLSVASG